jgi:hypothetical protein
MACGVGACLGCVVKGVGHAEDNPQYLCACKQGPVFRAEQLDWSRLGEEPGYCEGCKNDEKQTCDKRTPRSGGGPWWAGIEKSRDAGFRNLWLRRGIRALSGSQSPWRGGDQGLSLKPKAGNPTPRIAETISGMLNAIGLQNVGVDDFIKFKLPFCGSSIPRSSSTFSATLLMNTARWPHACRRFRKWRRWSSISPVPT